MLRWLSLRPGGCRSGFARPVVLFLVTVAFLLPDPIRSQPVHLSVSVLDGSTGRPTPVRARLVDAVGRVAPLPASAIGVMYGMWDHADGYAYQPDSSFYCPGTFELDLAPGRYTLTLARGNEYLEQIHSIDLTAGASVKRTYRMERWIDMASRGWYSVDDHIHVRRSPREDPLLLDWTEAEDINVGVLLQMGDFWEVYYPQYAWGEKGVYQEGNYLLTSGQEDPRTPELGHALGMGAADRVRYKNEYYYYDRVFDRLHELGGSTGYAHQGESFHGHRGLTLDGLRGKVDVLEVLQFCVEGGPLLTDNYYRVLDLGFELTATAGSDFPWCGKDHRYGVDMPREKAARIGNARFYTYVGDSLSYTGWKAGLNAGHTFVSSGPVVLFTVDGHLPGDHLDLAGKKTVRIVATAYGHRRQVPLASLQIVGHGRVIREVKASEPGQSVDSLTLAFDLPVDRGLWLAARVEASPLQFAHTTPVYVTVNQDGFHNPETVSQYLTLSEQYLQDLENVLAQPGRDVEHQAWKYREGLEQRIRETRAVIEQLRKGFQ